ncbi:hypothetical protein BpHYR1_038270 [Brachionus plicatilis]|uniref:Uncharacterized protein n=1 Tax=Brachionus plicatilis TaxID=10195 RepID=A0A3M7RHS1_BRAPC|nr:hypothetical protein BpHYR1_038270 [Brachionus plicatilis]
MLKIIEILSLLTSCVAFSTDLVCFNTTRPFNLTIQCSLRALTNSAEGTIDFGDGSSSTFKTNIDQPTSKKNTSIDSSFNYLLLNSEFLNDAEINGFRIKTDEPGLIELRLVEISNCGQTMSCSNFFSKIDIMPNFTTIYSWTINLTLEESDYRINQLNVSKGQLLILDQKADGQVMVESSSFVSDLKININALEKNLKSIDSKFSIRPLIENFVETLHSFEKSYQTPGAYKLLISFNINSLIIEKNLEIHSEQNFDFICSSFVQKKVNCSASLVSNFEMSKTTIQDHDYFPKPQVVDFLGIEFPPEPSEIFFHGSQFLLTSSEFRFDLKIRGFEIFATKRGYVWIKLVQVNICGLEESCLSYLSQTNGAAEIKEFKSWQINLDLGINRIILDFPCSASKGMVLLLDQYDGKVGMDNSANVLPDFQLIQTTTAPNLKFKILDRVKNMRFCVNILILENLFRYFIFTSHTFSTYGQKVLNGINNNSSISRNVSLNKIKNIDFVCSNKTNDLTTKCWIEVITSQTNENLTISLENQLADKIVTLDKGRIAHSFGIDVPYSLGSTNAVTKEQVVLLNSEFRFDSNLDSIELYATTAGKITLDGIPVTCGPVREEVGACLAVANQLALNCTMTSSGVPCWTVEAIRRQPLIAVDKAYVVVAVLNLMELADLTSGFLVLEPVECGIEASCAYHYSLSRKLVNVSSLPIGTFNIKIGYNILWLDKLIPLKSGSLLMLTQQQAKLALYEDDNLMYSDYFIIGDMIHPLNIALKTAVYLKANIDQLFLKNKFFYFKKFQNTGIYNSQLTLVDSTLKVNSLFMVTDDKFFDIFCYNNNTSLDRTLNCSVYQITQSRENMIEIDLGNGVIKNFNTISNDDIFKIPVSNYASGLNEHQAYLSINTETKFDTLLYGFELYARSSGNFRIKAFNFTECPGEFCSKYFKDSMEIPNYIVVNEWTFYALKGYNKFVLMKAEKVLPGLIFGVESTSFLEIDGQCDAFYSDFFIYSSQIFKIDQNKNCKAFFRVLTEQTYYLSETFFQHQFQHLGKHEFTVTNLNSTIMPKKFAFNVTSKQSIDIICEDEIFSLNKSLSCSIILTTTDKTDIFDVNQTKTYTVNPEARFFYFGANKMNLGLSKTYPFNGSFILPSTEFQFSSHLTGFEFLSTKDDTLDILVYEIRSCINESSKNCILKLMPEIEDLSTVYNIGTFGIKKGFNRILLPKAIWIEKKKFIGLHSKNPIAIPIDDLAQSIISDYYLNKNHILKIDLKNNFRFCFRALIDQEFYSTTISYFQNFEFFNTQQTFELNSQISSKNFFFTKKINIQKFFNQIVYCKYLSCSHLVFDSTVNCSLLFYSRSSDIDLSIDFGDGTFKKFDYLKEYNIKVVNYVGPLIPHSLSNQHPYLTTGKYLLKNTEFQFDSLVNGFELYSLARCTSCVSISIVSFENKCIFEQTCGNNISLVIRYVSDEWLFDVTSGYNILKLKEWVLVNKHSMVMIKLDSTAKVAYDISGLARESDYSISSNLISRLNPILNYQIFLNVFLAKKYSQVDFSFTHQYLRYGFYNITLTSASSKLETEILITKKQFLDAYCTNSGNTLDKTVHCKATAFTLSSNDEFSISYPNGSTSFHNFSQSKTIDYFGSEVPKNELGENLPTSSGTFVLPLTEFKFDSFILGLEFYAANAGEIQIFIDSNENCRMTRSCSELILESFPNYLNWQQIGSAKFTLIKGYNKIGVEKIFPKIKKGSILRITHNNIVAIDQNNPHFLSDYRLSNTLSKLNISSNCRFYANVLVDTQHWIKTLDFSLFLNQSLNNDSSFNFTLAFSNDGYELNKYFQISDYWYLDISCPKNNTLFPLKFCPFTIY